MSSRPFNISRVAMRQTLRIERVVRRLDHPCQGGFIALTNAIEWQAEIGRGDPESIHHLGLPFWPSPDRWVLIQTLPALRRKSPLLLRNLDGQAPSAR